MSGTAVQSSEPASLDTALKALADGSRRSILALVGEEPRAVGDIAEQLTISQQAVSHHLRVLRSAGLVSEAREGTRHLFAIRTDGFGEVRQYLEIFWPDRLSALKRAVESTAGVEIHG